MLQSKSIRRQRHIIECAHSLRAAHIFIPFIYLTFHGQMPCQRRTDTRNSSAPIMEAAVAHEADCAGVSIALTPRGSASIRGLKRMERDSCFPIQFPIQNLLLLLLLLLLTPNI